MRIDKYNKKTKFSALAVCLLLTAIVAIGGTLAYIVTQAGPVINIFNPATPDIEIEEEFSGAVKTNVVVTNTGEVDSYIRAKVIISWKDADGKIYPAVPVKGEDYTIKYGIDYGINDWIYVEDEDCWYYTKSVPATDPDSKTTELIKEAKWIKACEYNTDGVTYSLNIEILSQSIQSTPASVVAEKWGVKVAGDGTISK